VDVNWRLYVDDPERRALEHCSGSMDEGDGEGGGCGSGNGWGDSSDYGDGYGRGDGYGWVNGNGRGDGSFPSYGVGDGCSGGGCGGGDGTSASKWERK
jgi:hypothetical protein